MGRFREALAAPGLGAIAEIKRRSPSAGDLRPDADPACSLPRTRGRALRQSRFWSTSASEAPGTTCAQRTLPPASPLLAKGFFHDRSDLVQAREAGADAALLLLRDLDDGESASFLAAAHDLGLDVLVEAHDAEELERAIALGAEIVGLNARDLSTFEIDRAQQLELVSRTPRDRVVVAESGIASRAQGAAAELAGADAVLVGSALMRAADPAAKLAELLSRPLVKVCGLTREEDVAAAAEAGADLAGFVLAESPRRAEAPLPVPETMLSVAVLVGAVKATPTDLVQLYESENGHRARDGVLLQRGETVATVLDLPWLEEDDGHWANAARVDGRVLLAGGLGPENVRAAIEAVGPWCVDASRSLEAAPGIKDHDRVRAFVEAAR